MREPKIFFAEDSPIMRNLVKETLDPHNYKITVEVKSLAEAEKEIESAVLEGINVAILDGSLGTGLDDGEKIARMLRDAIPGIKIISFSSSDTNWADKEVKKGIDELEEIVHAIEGWLV